MPATAANPYQPEQKPSLEELGLDLLEVGKWERAITLSLPFIFAGAFFVFSTLGWWWLAVPMAMAQSFVTYGSISHDLVHRTLRLPAWLNETLLCVIELISFRSGHAYRASHLHHHARFPHDDDPEGRAARYSWWQALLCGLITQPQLWWRAVRSSRGNTRRWALAEGAAIAGLILFAIWAMRYTVVPAAYAGLIIAGSWIFPFVTSYLPHNARGADPLHQTRLFRGRVLSCIAFDHLYHLEHHLYPQVPHHRWPELARRLDPYFARQHLEPIVLWR